MLDAGRTRTLAAVVSRLIPTDDLGPGAAEAGVADFIERELGGPLHALAPVYDEGLDAIDARARAHFGRGFAALTAGERDAALRETEALDRAFFDVVLNHCIDGFLSDPVHGGNRDLVGWRLVGYAGVNLAPEPAEQKIDHVVPFHGTTVAAFTQFEAAPREDV